jgi:hypothetical protein
MSNRKVKFIKLIFLLTILCTFIAVLTLLLLQENTAFPRKEFESDSKFASGKGISFVETHGDKLIYRVSIDSFSIERARLGPFAIGPLIVAHLNEVKIDLYHDGIETNKSESKVETQVKGKGEWSSMDFERPILNISRNLPHKIKNIRLDGICFNLWDSGQKIFSLSGKTAIIDRKTGEIIFTGHVKMDASENGNLLSHRIRWDRRTGLFKVIDAYLLTKDGKAIEGRGIETDYSLKKITHLISKN